MRDRAAHRLQRLRRDQRRVAEDHQDVVGALLDRGARGEHRVRGAAPLGLHEHLGLGQRVPRLVGDRVRIRPDHHGGPVDAGAAHRGEHMGKQRAPGDRVQHLRTRGTHPRPLAGGEHDRQAGLFSSAALKSDGQVAPSYWGNRPEERWKAGTARTAYGGNRWILLPFFTRLIRSRSLSLMTAVRRTQLARLGVWIGLATVAVLTAVLAARTETGVRRIATLLSPAPPDRAGAQRKGPRPADRATASSTRRPSSAGSARRSACSRPTATGCSPASTRSSAISRTSPARSRAGRKAPQLPDILPSIPARRRPSAPAAAPRCRPRSGAAPAAGHAKPESRRRRPPRDQQPGGRRIGRDQDRVRRRSRRQCHRSTGCAPCGRT